MAEDASKPRRNEKAKANPEDNGKAKKKAAAEGDATPNRRKRRKQAEAPPQVVVRPMAGPTKRRKRHTGMLVSALIAVLVPLSVVAWYLYGRAVDQYASNVGFTVRQEDGAASSALIGGLAAFTGANVGGGASDSDILFEFIQSQALVASVDDKLDLWGHYTVPHDADPYFALKPGGSIEDLQDYWNSMVTVHYDQGTGLIGVTALAFSPDYARAVAEEVVAQSQNLVNDLNQTAREDMLRNAQEDVETSLTRLKEARQALIDFRTRTQIVDPATDLESRMGVQNSLQQQLAQALIDYDLQIQSTGEDDPRVVQARRKIEVIRARLSEERRSFAETEGTSGVAAYPALIAEYEALAVDREFAEQTYRGALAALDGAKANASRQSRYLATYIQPTLPQEAEYPRRIQIVLVTFIFLLLGWAMFVLIYYSIRDRN